MAENERESGGREQSEGEAAVFAVERLARRLTEQQASFHRVLREVQIGRDSQEKRVLEFIGWLSADIEELHHVEVPRLADSWERFKQRGNLATSPIQPAQG